ncbi:hypothetical protein PACTADRAFT_32276 [Pachysolen tannophilus NRRL Y-2460]|uniref:Major facilitator superfamily (MFS) profile domain-containing protein n=1 Tax=Pachysolen tannophilus NRRL Y-2460 TaxID=669874 RepID=A0A1E4TYN2_PACTA|nr:hypothetical protein PACTADRAFT_32276 [Pachysolen tannophilus NRRL Y-2460]
MSQVDTENLSSAQTPVNDDLQAKTENNEQPLAKHDTVHKLIAKRPASKYLGVAIECLLVAFGGFVFGWDTGTIGGFTNMSDYKDRFGSRHSDGTAYLSNVRTGLLVSIFNIGCAIGGLTLARSGDMYGRKNGLIITLIVYIIGIIIQIASVSKWYQYFIGRIISGLGVGSIAVLCPMFIAEASPRQVRGVLVTSYQLMITLGIFLGYCTNYGTKSYSNSVQWRVPLGLCFAWALLMIWGLTFMPESPRYLCKVGRIDDAKKSISKVNKVPLDDPFVDSEIDVIMAGIEREKLAGNASWKELFVGKPRIFYRVFMGVMMQSLQQLTGDNYFFYYGTTIFTAVGLSDSFETSIILGLVNLVSTFISFYVIGRFTRRQALMWGSAGMVACLVVYASVGVTRLWPNGYSAGTTSKGAGNCMIVFACFFIVCFATTWGPGVYVVISETFPLRIRQKGMAVATAANWIWGFLISFFTPFITTDIHFAYGYVFMGCLVFSWFFVGSIVYETKDLSLEDVDILYSSSVKPWNSTAWVRERIANSEKTEQEKSVQEKSSETENENANESV